MEEKEFKAWLDEQRRSIDLRLTDNGTWLHNGEPFVHRGLIKAFNRGIGLHQDTREPIIKIGHTWCYFKSEQSPFIVTRLVIKDQKVHGLLLNTDEEVDISGTRPSYRDGRLMLATVDGRILRLSRSAQAALAPHLTTDEKRFILNTTGGQYTVVDQTVDGEDTLN